ncbi:MAG: hypothetical protein QW589_05925 [Candidatus Bathyarchaeia archaeon]
MVNKILTKFKIAKKIGKKKGTIYKSPRIYLPTRLTEDSRFPFKENDPLLIKINGKKLIIQKAPKKLKRKKTKR